MPDWPLVMGVLNVTPDSFSDGGAWFDVDAAIAHGRRLIEDGADILDIGGESTRPGSKPLSPEDEQRRVVPVIAALRGAVPISVDTRHASTMRAAVNAGADIVNDISGLMHDPDSAATVRMLGCKLVVMHMRGTPETMNGHAVYSDVVREVRDELAVRIAEAGIERDLIAIDPGIGFAKTTQQNVELLRGLDGLAELGCRILVGASRKRFLGDLTGVTEPSRRDAASLAVHLFALSRGASIIRAHDVAGSRQAITMWRELHL